MNERVASLLEEYRQEHKDRMNQFFHFFGVLLVIAALFVLANNWLLFGLVMMFTPIWYAYIGGWRGAIVAVAMQYGLFSFHYLKIGGWLLAIILFVTGWFFLNIGHFLFEGNKPASYRNPLYVLVAPIWLVEIICLPIWKKFKTPYR